MTNLNRVYLTPDFRCEHNLTQWNMLSKKPSDLKASKYALVAGAHRFQPWVEQNKMASMRGWVVSLSFLSNCIRVTETSAIAVVNCSSKLERGKFNNMTLGLWSHSLLLTWKCSYSLCSMVQHHYKFHQMTYQLRRSSAILRDILDSIMPSRISTLC